MLGREQLLLSAGMKTSAVESPGAAQFAFAVSVPPVMRIANRIMMKLSMINPRIRLFGYYCSLVSSGV